MKIISFIFFAAGVLVTWTNSKKETPNPLSLSAVSKAKTYGSGNLFYNYAFDAQDRVVVITRRNGSKDEYEYSQGLVTGRIYPGGVYQYSYIEQLEEDGNSKHITRRDLQDNGQLYFYKADKRIAKQISSQNGKSAVFD